MGIYEINKKTKILISFFALFFAIISGTIFGLAKTGKINFKMLADTLLPGNIQYANIQIKVLNGQNGSGLGSGYNVHVSDNIQNYVAQTDSNSIATFNSMVIGNTYQAFVDVPPTREGESCGASTSFTVQSSNQSFTLNVICNTGANPSPDLPGIQPPNQQTDIIYYKLQGRVFDETTKRPLFRCTVKTVKQSQIEKTTSTDTKGNYYFDIPLTNSTIGSTIPTYSLVFSASGYQEKSFNLHKLQPNIDTNSHIISVQNLYLEPIITNSSPIINDDQINLIGRIINRDEIPINGVKVEVNCEPSCNNRSWSGISYNRFNNNIFPHNLEIGGIYNIKNSTLPTNLKIDFITDYNFFVDTNNNGLYNDDTKYITITSNDIWQQNGKLWAKFDVKVLKKPRTNLELEVKSAYEPFQSLENIKVQIEFDHEGKTYTYDCLSFRQDAENYPNCTISNIWLPTMPTSNKVSAKVRYQYPNNNTWNDYLREIDLDFSDTYHHDKILINPPFDYFFIEDENEKSLLNVKIQPQNENLSQCFTDNRGIAYIGKYSTSYCDWTITSYESIKFTLSKPGYYSRTEEDIFTNGFPYNHNYKLHKHPGPTLIRNNDDTSRKLLVNVINYENGTPIKLAEVKIYKRDSQSQSLIKTRYTDLNGRIIFEFNTEQLTDGNYTLTANKRNYYLFSKSFIPFVANDQTLPAEIDIFMLPGENNSLGQIFNYQSINSKFQIINQNDVSYQTSIINTENNNEELISQWPNPKLYFGKTYNVVAKYNNSTISRVINVPENYLSMTLEQKATWERENLIFIFTTDIQDKIEYIRFNIILNGQPIDNMNLFIQFSNKLSQPMFGAITNRDGYAILKDDFFQMVARPYGTQSFPSPEEYHYMTRNRNFTNFEDLELFSDDVISLYVGYYPSSSMLFSRENVAIKDLIDNLDRCYQVRDCTATINIDTNNTPNSCTSNNDKILKLEIDDFGTPADTSQNIDDYINKFNNILNRIQIYKKTNRSWKLLSRNSYTITTPKITTSSTNEPVPMVINIDIKLTTGNGSYKVKIPPFGESENITFYDNECEKLLFYSICSDLQHAINYSNGVTLVFSDENMFNEYKNNFQIRETYLKLINRIITLKSTTYDIGNIDLFISPDNTANAFAFSVSETNIQSCHGVKNAQRIAISKGFIDEMYQSHIGNNLENIIDHEYGHLIYIQIQDINRFRSFIQLFQNLYEKMTNGDYDPIARIVFQKITDGFLQVLPKGSGGHPWDSDSEFFASLYAGMVGNSRILYNQISYNTDNEQAKNLLSFLWNIMQQKIVRGNHYFGQHAFGTNFDITNYTFEQIINGHWEKNIFQNLNFNQKVQAAYKAYVAAYFTTKIKAGINNIRGQIGKLHALIDSLTPSLNKNVGNVHGYVYLIDPYNPSKITKLKKTAIKIGSKLAITNQNGYFSIKKLKEGNNKINFVRRINLGKTYTSSSLEPNKVKIIKNKNSRVDVYIIPNK